MVTTCHAPLVTMATTCHGHHLSSVVTGGVTKFGIEFFQYFLL
jgi:hypothetical protein